MRYRIEHQTQLQFGQAVHEHHCELRLSPREDETQRIVSFAISSDPPAHFFSYVDAFGNRVHHFSVIALHKTLTTKISVEVETRLDNPFNYPLIHPVAETAWYDVTLRRQPNLWQYVLHESPETPAFNRLDLAAFEAVPRRDYTQPVQVSILSAMRWVNRALSYIPGTTQVHTPLAVALDSRSGVCQDFAHLLIALVRSWHVPARYVMGYLDPGLISDESLGQTQASHAWVEVLIPGAGWRGFDATHELVANHTYIPVAVGRDSRDAAPQRGSYKGEDVGQSPRITLMVARQAQ